MSEKDTSEKRFKVALSFPGEHRKYVSKVADILGAELGKDKVFYDSWYTAELNTLDLDIHLQNIYHNESEIVVPFLSKNYQEKDWCQLEWRAIRDLIKQRDQDIMPMRFDDMSIPGLFGIDGYLDLRQYTPKQTAKLILQRVELNETGKIKHEPEPAPIIKPWHIYASVFAVAASVALAYYFMSTAKPDPSKAIQLKNNLTLLPITVKPFEMGGSKENEQPVHSVVLPNNFWMSQTEISFAQYDAYALSTDSPTPSDETWGRLTRPVINVNAKEAEAYTAWLTENNDVGLSCRLPTEAEWEYAARAGTRTNYSWGDAADRTQANCAECDTPWSQQKQTAPVTSLRENNFGLKNMHGNVAEWVEDVWHDNYNDASNNGQAWLRGGYANQRVVRGGSLADKLDDLRSASRIGAVENERFRTIGFRVVCTTGSR